MTPRLPTVGSLLHGKYRLVSELGTGAAGNVFEAEHLIVGKRVAVKVLHAELARNPPLVARFVAEARAGARIGHANVVDIHDLGVCEDGTTYMVMELLRGDTLAELIERCPIAPVTACELILQVLSGLAAAHAQGIVHRDLKPANVIVTHPRPNRALVKVLDFGIAKGVLDAGSYVGDDGVVLGTPRYMPPEQALGRPIDGRADIYAVGTILYEMLSGVCAFHGATHIEVISKVIRGQHRPLGELLPALPAGLAAVVERAMAFEQHDRFESAEDMIEALLPFVSEDRLTSLVPRRPGFVTGAHPLVTIQSAPPAEPGGVRLNIPAYAPGPTVSLLSAPRFPRPASVPLVSDMPPDWSPLGVAAMASGHAERSAETFAPKKLSYRQVKTALAATAAGLGLGTLLAWLAGNVAL